MRGRILLCLLLWLLCGNAFAAEQRVALVIGNAAYRFDPLDNPVNDARLVAASLKQAGFDVTLAENLDRRGLLGALRAFGERLNDNSVAVLYYAGHGLQLRDRNYLIPVDAEIRSEDEIALAGIDIAFVLGRMSAARSRVNIVILDACRNNPFAGKSQHTAQGLAQMDAPVGTLLAYATAPGKLAADGLGGVNDKNGLYAQQLARQVLTPGLPVEHVFKRVREAVVRASREAQVPWESSSLQGEFAFVPAAAVVARDGAAEVEAAAELAFWNSVQATSRADDLRAYLRQYPRGRFSALAQSRLDAAVPAAAPTDGDRCRQHATAARRRQLALPRARPVPARRSVRHRQGRAGQRTRHRRKPHDERRRHAAQRARGARGLVRRHARRVAGARRVRALPAGRRPARPGAARRRAVATG